MFLVISHHILDSKKYLFNSLNFLQKKLLKNLKKIINISTNYKFLKEKIKSADAPYVPCLNIITRDLT